MRRDLPRRRITAPVVGLLLVAAAAMLFIGSATAGSTSSTSKTGALDCNGWSTIQHSVKPTGACTDIRGIVGVKNHNTWGGRFYDNGHYIGHDEPDLTFLSHKPGSGNDVTWTETLPHDPVASPTVDTPGSDVTHWFELSVAPWFSMALCNPRSYPLNPCTPNSDNNAPQGPVHGRRQLLPGGPVLSAGRGAVLRQHQLRQHALVRLAAHQRPRVHLQLRQLQRGLRGADELRVHPEGRHTYGPARPAGRERWRPSLPTARRCS